jgi:sugar phosphate isomerase/epimerase
MHIRYVVSSMVFWGREHHLSFEQECQFLKSLGLGVELWPSIKGHNECRYERRNWPRLTAATQDMLVSMRSRTDKPTIEQWNEQIECAKLLSAHIVADSADLGIPDGAEPNGTGFAAEVIRLAELSSVRLCLETGWLPSVKEIGQRYQSLSYCLDTGYANLDKDYSFKQYVDDLAPRIAHLHLTDNYGLDDDHLPPGVHGGISRENWDYLLEALGRYDNDIVGSLEMCPRTPGVMIHQASEYIFDILKWPNRPQDLTARSSITYSPI